MMEKLSFDPNEVFRAAERINGLLPVTPLDRSIFLSDDDRNVFLKLECMQPVRAFKVRGALSRMTVLTDDEKKRGVATISSGNHGASVAYAAKLLGIDRAMVIVPSNAPLSKTDKIERYGGTVMRMGSDYDEAHRLGMKLIEDSGMTYIDAYYDDPLIYAGQGTIALEILRQESDIDTIVVPIGGGGLITGIASAAKALKPGIRIIGVQTETCPAMIASFRDNVFYDEYPVTGETVCDALVGGVGLLSYSVLKDLVDDIIEVKEKDIRQRIRHMVTNEKIVAEGGSCTTVAAVMHDKERVGGKNIALVISGGNIDGELLKEILNESN